LRQGDVQAALEPVISRNLFPDGDSNGREMALACYMARQYGELSTTAAGEIVQRAAVFKGTAFIGTVSKENAHVR
jgi:hypothetical protein